MTPATDALARILWDYHAAHGFNSQPEAAEIVDALKRRGFHVVAAATPTEAMPGAGT